MMYSSIQAFQKNVRYQVNVKCKYGELAKSIEEAVSGAWDSVFMSEQELLQPTFSPRIFSVSQCIQEIVVFLQSLPGSNLKGEKSFNNIDIIYETPAKDVLFVQLKFYMAFFGKPFLEPKEPAPKPIDYLPELKKTSDEEIYCLGSRDQFSESLEDFVDSLDEFSDSQGQDETVLIKQAGIERATSGKLQFFVIFTLEAQAKDMQELQKILQQDICHVHNNLVENSEKQHYHCLSKEFVQRSIEDMVFFIADNTLSDSIKIEYKGQNSCKCVKTIDL